MAFVKQAVVFTLNRVIYLWYHSDSIISTSLSEEKECSELPEQPSAPGDQEERSV